MEGTLTDSITRADKTFAFKAPREYAEILKAGNVDAASLANNHSRDYGDKATPTPSKRSRPWAFPPSAMIASRIWM